MITAKTVKKANDAVKMAKKKNKSVGLVPTMGALHRGHLSLLKKAKKENDYLVASLFINPLQFGPKEDFKKYPRSFKKDKDLFKKTGVNLLFHPQADRIYSRNFSTFVEETKLSKVLCGLSRPGHFRGVCTVVAKLFNLICPDSAYFGQKDYQQALIIKKMVKDLNFPVKIKITPTIREKDGLALSSRNAYLSQKERQESRSLFQALSLARKMIKKGENNPEKIRAKVKKIIKANPTASVDYVEVRDAGNLKKIPEIKGVVFVGVAACFGKTRLIDNIIVKS